MKKLISVLTASLIITPVATQVISCNGAIKFDLKNPLLIGKDIDNSKAKDSSGDYKFGVSNFYVIGDSLSDVNGISSLIQNKFKNPLVDLELKIGGDGYGYYDNENFVVSTFTNGKPVSWQIADQLGLEKFETSNRFVAEQEEYGKNYSIGGATAGASDNVAGIILNEATIDKQSSVLLSQQVVNEKDVVLFEIGGNDLNTLINLKDSPTVQLNFINDSINRLRNTFFNLLNNGVKNIIFMTPPRMDIIPTHQDKTGNELEALIRVCDEFYHQMIKTVEEVKSYYPNTIALYDLYQDTNGKKGETNLEKRWLSTISEENKLEAQSNLRKSYTDLNKIKIKISVDGEEIILTREANDDENIINWMINKIEEFLNNNDFSKKTKVVVELKSVKADVLNENACNFFFADFIHPTTDVHKIVADDMLKMIEEISKKWKK